MPVTRSQARMLRSLGNPMNDKYEMVARGPKSRKTTKPRSSKKSKRKTHKKGRVPESRYLRQVRNSRKAVWNRMRRRTPPDAYIPSLKQYRANPFVRLSPTLELMGPVKQTAADRHREAEDASYERKMRYELGLERDPLFIVDDPDDDVAPPMYTRNTDASNRSYYEKLKWH